MFRELVLLIPGILPAAKFLRLCIGILRSGSFPFLTFAGPGHFYSPVPSLKDLHIVDDTEFDALKLSTNSVSGINLNVESQLRLVDELATYHDAMPFPDHQLNSNRYYFDNSFFSYGDAVALYGILHLYRPNKIIEVGSGFSTALMLDTRSRSKQISFQLTTIDPYPDRLINLVEKDDESSFTLHQEIVQKVPIEIFEQLESNDILFIDSSHVGKLNSDLLDILFRILPVLQKGVLVHFHDIPWPFEYPLQWFKEGRAWNEAYYIRSLLQGSSDFEILLFNDFLISRHAELLQNKLPYMLKQSSSKANLSCSSLWLRKT